jgi:putative FmdB family regulatory protein
MLHYGPSLALIEWECQEEPVPTYQYQCTECGEALEAVQKFTDDALTECPACQGRLRKVFSAVGVVFKGSGFYRNDSRGSSSGSSPAKSAEPKSESKSESKGDSAGSAAKSSDGGSAAPSGSKAPAASSGSTSAA